MAYVRAHRRTCTCREVGVKSGDDGGWPGARGNRPWRAGPGHGQNGPGSATPPGTGLIFGRRRRGTPGSEHSPVRGVDRPACDVQACSWPAQGKKHYGAIPAPSVVTQCANMVLRTPYLRETAQCWRDGVGTGSRSRARTCRMPVKLGGLLEGEVESQRLKTQRLFLNILYSAQKGALRIKFTIAPKSRTTRDRDVRGLFGPRGRYDATYLERKGSRRCLPPHTPLRAGSGACSKDPTKNGK